jgi:hypothetical protein
LAAINFGIDRTKIYPIIWAIMSIFLLLFIAQFSRNYQYFVDSPASDSVFIDLTRGYQSLSDFADDPVVLWFWRSTSGDPQADSLLKKLHMRRNFYLSAVLRWEAREAADYDIKVSKLNLATHLDSAAVENFLSFLSLALMRRDPRHIQTALFLPVLSDFRNQLFAMTNLIILAFAAAFLWGVIYVIVKIVYYLPALGHQIWPRFHFRFADIIKVLVLLIPIIVLRNPYLIFVCYAFLLMLVMTTREKNWLRLDIIILLFIFVVSLPINNFIVFLKENNQSHKIYELLTYDTAINAQEIQDIDQEFLAYGLKQQGNIEKAMELYENLFYGGKRDIAIVNNLANIYAAYDETALAESLYNMAIYIQDRGEPYFNLGLLKLRNIEYSESSRYMEEARRRGLTSMYENFIDITPDNNDLYKHVLAEKLESNGFVKTAYIIPLLLILIMSFIPFKLSPPFFCSSCARPICKDCLREIDQEIICTECFTKFKSTKKDEMEQALRRTVGRRRRATKKIILYALNIIIPGAGLIYIRKHLVGSILVSLVLLGYIPLFSPQIFVRPTGWIILPLGSVFFVFAAMIAIISYIISFTIIKEHHAH